jgi:hypothetical protein
MEFRFPLVILSATALSTAVDHSPQSALPFPAAVRFWRSQLSARSLIFEAATLDALSALCGVRPPAGVCKLVLVRVTDSNEYDFAWDWRLISAAAHRPLLGRYDLPSQHSSIA